MSEIVYVPALREFHWYSCAEIPRRIRRRRAYVVMPFVNPVEVVCHVCQILVGSPS